MNQWVCRQVVLPQVAKAHHRNDTNTPKRTTEPNNHPQASPILTDNPCGPDDRDCHTHTQPRRTIVPKAVATPLAPAVHQGPTSRRCGHTRRRSTPTPRGHAQTTHTQPTQSRCLPFIGPHVHKAARSNDTRQECTNNSAKAMGDQPTIWGGHTMPTRSPKEGKGGVHEQRILC